MTAQNILCYCSKGPFKTAAEKFWNEEGMCHETEKKAIDTGVDLCQCGAFGGKPGGTWRRRDGNHTRGHAGRGAP